MRNARAEDSSDDAINWAAIESFVGFGPPDAPYVFIGMEEGLNKDADLVLDLQTRSSYQPYMDLLAAQNALSTSSQYLGESAKCQRTWRPMCDLMLRFEGKLPTGSMRNRYQGTRLGRIPGDTLLSELLPYPRNKTGQEWPYAALGRYRSFEEYKDAILWDRISLLRTALGAHPRRLIVCYGSSYWADYERLVNVKQWHASGTFRFGKEETLNAGVVLARHFSDREFNSDEQLAQFFMIANAAVTLSAE